MRKSFRNTCIGMLALCGALGGTAIAYGPRPLLACVTLGTPTNMSPATNTSVGGTPVKLSWNGVSGAQLYDVNVFNYSSTAPNNEGSLISTQRIKPGYNSPGTYCYVSLNKGAAYTWRVRAYQEAPCSPGPWTASAYFYLLP